MNTITQSGHVAIAQAVKSSPLYFAWGTGDGLWIDPPPMAHTANALKNEIGRCKVTKVSFIAPDDEGPIVRGDGKFSISKKPTNTLLVQAAFDLDDAAKAVIREFAICVGSKLAKGKAKKGKRYFEPAEVAEAGQALHLKNVAPIFRKAGIRENFEVVIEF